MLASRTPDDAQDGLQYVQWPLLLYTPTVDLFALGSVSGSSDLVHLRDSLLELFILALLVTVSFVL